MILKYTKIGSVVLVGTSHIARESVANVAGVIEHFEDPIVGIELDRHRFRALVSSEKRRYMPTWQNIRHYGVTGTLFAVIAGYVSQKLGEHVGVQPGDDMLSAINTAKKHNLTIALLDQPINITLKRFSHTVTLREKFRFVTDIFQGIFLPRITLRKYGIEEFDLCKVPSSTIIMKLMDHLHTRYPNVYEVLINERNQYMVHRIRRFQQKYSTKIIVVIVGAGHEDGMKKLLKNGAVTSFLC